MDGLNEYQSSMTHMKSEILAQPAALQATIEALLPRTAEIAELARGSRQVLFFARGTSDNAAVYCSYLIQTAAGRLASLGSPSVATAYASRVDLSGVMAVGLSQSGRTEEIIETLEWARACGAQVVAITNSGDSPLAELADLALVTAAGAELAVPATKTFTCQLAALAVLSIGLGADLSVAEFRRLPAAIDELLAGAMAPGYGLDAIVDEANDKGCQGCNKREKHDRWKRELRIADEASGQCRNHDRRSPHQRCRFKVKFAVPVRSVDHAHGAADGGRKIANQSRDHG